MAQGVRCGRLADPRLAQSRTHRALEALRFDVVPTNRSRAWVEQSPGGNEDILPSPFARRMRRLACQSKRQNEFSEALGKFGLVQRLDAPEVGPQRIGQRPRQHRDAVLGALALANHDLATREVDVLHAQTQTFHDAHAGAVEQPQDQARRALAQHQQALHFLRREDDRQASGTFADSTSSSEGSSLPSTSWRAVVRPRLPLAQPSGSCPWLDRRHGTLTILMSTAVEAPSPTRLICRGCASGKAGPSRRGR